MSLHPHPSARPSSPAPLDPAADPYPAPTRPPASGPHGTDPRAAGAPAATASASSRAGKRALRRPGDLLAIAVLGMGFIGLSLVIEPSPSSADLSRTQGGSESIGRIADAGVGAQRTWDVRPARDLVAAPQFNDEGEPLLGELVGPTYRVWAYGGRDEPTYTVVTRDGRILAENLLVDEVYKAFPELPLHELVLDPAHTSSTLDPRPARRPALMIAE